MKRGRPGDAAHEQAAPTAKLRRTHAEDGTGAEAADGNGAEAGKLGAIREVGVIVHWGVYSLPAFDSVESARRRTTQNGSEWYEQRLCMTASSYRPTSGWREAQAYHRKHYGGPATSYRSLRPRGGRRPTSPRAGGGWVALRAPPT